MNASTAPRARHRWWLGGPVAGLLLVTSTVAWSPHVPAQQAETSPLTAAELEALVGPIALYPDDILAVVLPASTYPLEVVQAARFLEDRQADPALEPNDEWDDSVVALLNYPDVIRLMDEDLDWTWDLGEAVLDDQAAVLDAIQAFRDRAYEAGNLVTDEHQTVTEDEEGISIAPADPEVVYIPYYEPASVIVYQPRPVFHYYPFAYPLYYYPYPIGYRFRTGFFFGVTSAFAIGWDSHHIHLHHHTHYRHPYYRRTYYTPYYARRGINVTVNVNNYRNIWRPRQARGARPYDGIRAVRSNDRVHRTYDGRRYRYSDGTNARRGDQRLNRLPGPSVAGSRSASIPRQGGQRPAERRQRAAGNDAPGATHRTPTDRRSTYRRSTFGGVDATNRGLTNRRLGTTPRNVMPSGRTARDNPDRATPSRKAPDRARVYPRMLGGTNPSRTAPSRSSPDRRIVTRPTPQRDNSNRVRPQSRQDTIRQAPARQITPRSAPQPQRHAPQGNGGTRFGGVARQSRAPSSRAGEGVRPGRMTQRAANPRARAGGTPSRQPRASRR